MVDASRGFRSIIAESSHEELGDFFAKSYPHDQNLLHFPALAMLICGLTTELPASLIVTEQDVPYAASLAEKVAKARAGGGGPRAGRLSIGRDLDAVSYTCFQHDLTALQLANLAWNVRLVPRRKIAAVLMARNEGIYLVEWMAHYRLLGVEHFFIYTNDNDDGSDALLTAFLTLGNVTVIDNVFETGIDPQKKAYQHAVLLLDGLQDFEWVMFIDADEFLIIDDSYQNTIEEFIADLNSTGVNPQRDIIRLPWHWRFASPSFSTDTLSPLSKYCHAEIQGGFKSISRVSRIVGMCEVHVPTTDADVSLCNADGCAIGHSDRWLPVEKSYIGPTLEHFWSKSFLDFVIKKGRGDSLELSTGQFKREYDQFFEWNPRACSENFRPIPPQTLEALAAEIVNISANVTIANALIEVHRKHRERIEKLHGIAELRETYETLSEKYFK